MSKMQLDEFNPLDVLAAAATLQHKKPSDSSSDQEDASADSSKDVVRMKGQSAADHSYAWSGPSSALLQKAESTEDDGYCSRCSLDSPGQSSRSDVDLNEQDVFSDTDLRSPSIPGFKSPVLPLSPKGAKKKPAKVVILSPDPNLKLLKTNNNNSCACQEFTAHDDFTGKSEEAPESPVKTVHTVMEPVDSWAECSQDPAETKPNPPTQEESMNGDSKEEVLEISEAPAPESCLSPVIEPKEEPPAIIKSPIPAPSSSILIVHPLPPQPIEHPSMPPPSAPPSTATGTVSTLQLLSPIDSKTNFVVKTSDKRQLSLLKTIDKKCSSAPSLLLVKQEDHSALTNVASASPMLSSAPILPSLSSDWEKPESNKINIKISGSRVIDVSSCDEQAIHVKKQATSIGHLGSLSWQTLVTPQDSDARSATSSPFLSTDGSLPSSPRSATPVLQQPKRSYQRKNPLKRSASVAAITSLDEKERHSYTKKSRKGKASGALSPLELSQMKQSAQNILRLHPLIDHDYCMFSEFNAEIQSSIIATTETKLRTERSKNGGKKAERISGKNVKGAVPVIAPEKQVKRKYTKRKHKNSNRVAPVSVAVKSEEVTENSEEASKPSMIKAKKRLMDKKLSSYKYSPYKERPDKNYVKIPGSYQDDFVYYATRKTQKRMRKGPELPLELPSKSAPKPVSSQVGGINVFDWYREMAKVDKTKFGVGSSVEEKGFEEEKALLSADKGNMMLNHSSAPESEVLDFVINMDSSAASEGGDSNAGGAVEKVETVETTEDIDLMAEQVRSMLNSMNETDLRLLSENLGTSEDGPSTSMLDSSAALPSTSGAAPLLGDLDDINDSDLITSSDISHDINMMLGESQLLPPSAPPVEQLPAPSTPPVSSSISSVSGDHAVPELTTVNMYWNDLPGLIIDGTEHVRLVDIHKQVLPAKDTGILKKRCQMMALPILNCSDLQRDFLIRYMNAAKSKSCVITSKECAKTLIGFYVDPRPRVPSISGRTESESEEVEKVKKKPPVKNSAPEPPAPSSDVGAESIGEKPKRALTIDDCPSPAPKPKQNATRPSRAAVVAAGSKQTSPTSSSGSPPDASDIKRSARLRRTRKVSYAAMHNGSIEEEEEAPATPKITVQLNVQGAQDEQEIRRLMSKRRKKTLSKREASKLLSLQERVKKRRRKQKENLRVRLNKAKMKTKVLQESQPAEHCYASWHAKLGAHQSNSANAALSQPDSPAPVQSTQKQQQSEDKRPVLLVSHRDDRQGHRGRAQDAELLLDLFLTKDAACLLCCMCKEHMSVKKFLKHAHRPSHPDELIAVTMPQKLELTSCNPSEEERALWAEYVQRSQDFEEEQRKKKTPAASSPDDNEQPRQSTRLRRRKQMHPMESYVFEEKKDHAEL